MKASGPPITTKRAAGRALATTARGPDEVLDPFLAIEPADPADDGRIGSDAEQGARLRPICGAELRQVHHRGDLEGVMRAARHPGRGGIADGGADPDIARRQVLRAGRGFGDETAVLDQRRPEMQPFERRVDVGDVLRGDDDVIGRDLGGEIADRVLERQRIGDAVHIDA